MDAEKRVVRLPERNRIWDIGPQMSKFNVAMLQEFRFTSVWEYQTSKEL